VPFAISAAWKNDKKVDTDVSGLHVNRYAMIFFVTTLIQVGCSVYYSSIYEFSFVIASFVLMFLWVRMILGFFDFGFPPMAQLLKETSKKRSFFSRFLTHMAVRWVLGFRFIRDVYTTHVLLLPLVIVAHCPYLDTLHTMFMFQVRPFDAEDDESDDEEESSWEEEGMIKETSPLHQ